MPKFCRHNRLIQNCPICSREQAVDARPLVSSSAPRVAEPRARTPRPSPSRGRPRQAPGRTGVTVRRVREAVDDGYRSPLAPGLRSSEDARRLAEEIAFASTRLARMASDPPGLYHEVADAAGDLEERTWLAFLIAYIYPLESDKPFAEIARVGTTWPAAEQLALQDVRTGPRTAYDPARGLTTIEAYRVWAGRAGSQADGFRGETGWSPERRFARTFERLSLPGLPRDARFELLTSLGALGVYELQAGSLVLGGSDTVTVAAKRALAIGDSLLLDRRATQLAAACQAPLAALDLALYNWERGERVSGGMEPAAEPGPAELEAALTALEL